MIHLGLLGSSRLSAMAEVFGIAAGVLSTTECISKAASLMIDYCQAPAQVKDLQVGVKA